MNAYFANLALEILSFLEGAGSASFGLPQAHSLIDFCGDVSEEIDGQPHGGKMNTIIDLAVDLFTAVASGDCYEATDCALELRAYCFDLLDFDAADKAA